MKIYPVSNINYQPNRKLSFKKDAASVALLESSEGISAKKDEAILKYLENAEKRDKQSVWAALIPTVLILPIVYYFAKKSGMVGAKNVLKEISGGFKSLSNDSSVPTLETCKSINPQLQEFLQTQVNHAKASAEQLRLTGKPKPAKKLLLYGPPGTGKTFFAKIFAKTLGADYLEIRYTDISRRYVGEQMEQFKKTFDEVIETAIKNKDKKYVLTFNEIDALIATQEHMVETGGGHVSTKIEERNAFLNYMDDIALKAPNITVIGTTNRIANNASLDGAAMSRFGERIKVDFPDKKCLYEALKAHLRLNEYGEEFVKENKDKLAELVDVMKNRGYSFRDLELMLNKSKDYHLNDSFKDKNVKFKFEYLERANKARTITDGESALAAAA